MLTHVTRAVACEHPSLVLALSSSPTFPSALRRAARPVSAALFLPSFRIARCALPSRDKGRTRRQKGGMGTKDGRGWNYFASWRKREIKLMPISCRVTASFSRYLKCRSVRNPWRAVRAESIFPCVRVSRWTMIDSDRFIDRATTRLCFAK